MASPQTENGYTKWANELLEALSRKRLAGQEYQVVLAVGRKTYGFGKKSDKISYGQLAEITGLDRRRVNKLVRDLKEKKVLGVTNNGDREPATVWINKDYEQWETVTKNGDIPNNGDRPVTNNGVKPVTNNGDHKRKKERKEIPSDFLSLSKRFLEYQKEQHGSMVKITEAKIQNGAEVIDKLIRLDGFSLEKDIRPALNWAVKDDFWATNILSLAGLRKKGANGEMKFQNLLASYRRNKPKTPKNTLVY